MADDQPFLLPVALDATSEATARVPDKFREVQWMRLPSSQVSPAFVAHVRDMLAAGDRSLSTIPSPSPGRQVAALAPRAHKRGILTLALAVLLVLAVAYFGWERFVDSKRPTPVPASLPKATDAAPAASIAVLPFVDMSEKKDQEYFSDGLTEELIDHLAQNAGLKVIARTSCFEFKGKNADIRAIAGKLNVANVLEGSVRKAGQALRITVQLIRASDGVHLWSKTYDRQLDDIFKIQDDIASTVTQAMNGVLSPVTPQAAGGTANAAAYTLYLQALSLYRAADSQAQYERAIAIIQDAIKADPRYVDAWSLLSAAQSAQADEGFGDQASLRLQAAQAADHAFELDPNSAAAHIAKARILFHDWEFAEADAHIRQASALEPRSSIALSWSATIAQTMGRLKEAEGLRLRAIQSDPVNPSRYGDLAGTLYSSGRFGEAYAMMRRYLDLRPASRGAHNFSGLLLLLKGDPKAALAEMEQETDPDYRSNCYCRVMVYDALGRSAEADQLLATFEKNHATDDAMGLAAVYARRRKIDLAFHWLDLAYQHRELNLTGILSDPLFNDLAADPRFKAILAKMKLPGRDAIT
jgi:TolB-like protein/Flp pilus assembly protein TadD